MKTIPIALVALLLFSPAAPVASSEEIEPVSLPIHLTEEEKTRLHEIGIRHRNTAPPTGAGRSTASRRAGWSP